mmetsp:Transcript_37559/g.98482  ORF Transcript_37559/g.98482 Transcript_37559/m.98482 type:complete len:300 (-) Transcript_37559:3287-4186(-)
MAVVVARRVLNPSQSIIHSPPREDWAYLAESHTCNSPDTLLQLQTSSLHPLIIQCDARVRMITNCASVWSSEMHRGLAGLMKSSLSAAAAAPAVVSVYSPPGAECRRLWISISFSIEFFGLSLVRNASSTKVRAGVCRPAISVENASSSAPGSASATMAGSLAGRFFSLPVSTSTTMITVPVPTHRSFPTRHMLRREQNLPRRSETLIVWSLSCDSLPHCVMSPLRVQLHTASLSSISAPMASLSSRTATVRRVRTSTTLMVASKELDHTCSSTRRRHVTRSLCGFMRDSHKPVGIVST